MEERVERTRKSFTADVSASPVQDFIHPKAELHKQSSLSPQDMSNKAESSFVGRCQGAICQEQNGQVMRDNGCTQHPVQPEDCLPHRKHGCVNNRNMLPPEAARPRPRCH